jgi:hypothetical protein
LVGTGTRKGLVVVRFDQTIDAGELLRKYAPCKVWTPTSLQVLVTGLFQLSTRFVETLE